MLERTAGWQRFCKVQVLVGLSVLLFMGGHWSVLMGSTGALMQLSGLSGCITNTGTGGACVQGNGLDGAGWVEISPDGNYVYVASFNSSTITTFSRNVTTGVLTQLPGTQGCVGESGNGSTCAHGVGLSGAVGLSLSPDGTHLYAVSRDNALAVFSRNTTTGVLTQLQGTGGCIADSGSSDAPNCAHASILGGPRSIKVSNDGANVYVGARDAGAVVIFSRNATTGALTQLSGLAGCVSKDGSGGLCAQGAGLVGARGITISNDNKNAYIATEGDANGNSALAVFSRNTVTGALTQLSAPAGCFAVNGDGVTCTAARGLVTVIHSVMSPDDNNLYVASRDSNSLAIFSRNTTTGALTQLSGTDGCIADSGGDPTCAAGKGLNQVVFVGGTQDGGNIYAASQVSNAIAVFSRNATTGALTQLSGTDGCVSSDGTAGSCAVGTALDGALSVNASPDGKNVYASAYIAGSLLAFSRTVPTPTTTMLTSSANPSTAGQSVTFTATVTATGSGTPSGTVSFVDGSTSIGSGTLNAAGQATFTTSSLTIATHSITAVYAGNSTFAGSTSAAVNQVVNPVVLTSTSTALTSSLNPSNTGQPVTFTATVTASSGTPPGTVNFLDGTTTIGSGTLNGGGQATFTTSSLTAATHSMTAAYTGNMNFAASTSPAVNQVVKGTTSTSVTSSVNPSISGQPVTFTASVTATSGSPSGTVTFMDGSVSLGPGTLSGTPPTATLATASLGQGSHVITAVYGGDGGFAGSTSPILSQVVTTGTNSRTFSFGDKGAAAFITDGSGSLRVGYGRVVPDAGQTTPSGIAIFGERDGGTLISEAGVPASPLIRNGRIYAEVSPNGFSGRGTDIGLNIANPGPAPATINFTYTRSDGTDLGGGSYTLGAGLQMACYLDQAPWNLPLNFQGTFTFTSTAPIAVVALQLYNNERGEPLITTLPVIDTNAAADSTPALLSQFADGSGWSTTLILVNQTETAQAGTIVFRDHSGNVVTLTTNSTTAASFAYSIPKHSSFKLQTQGGGPNIQVGSATVTPDAGNSTPVPLSISSFYNGQATQTQAGVPSNLGTAFRVYVEATANSQAIGGYDAGIAVANGSASQGTVTFELYTTAGAPTGLTRTIPLTAFGHLSEFLDQIFPTMTLPFQGVLRVSTTDLPAISTVAVRIRYNERNEFLMTTTPPSNETLQAGTAEMYFPEVANGAGWTTQFNLFSGVTNQATSGTLTFEQPDGNPFDIGTK